MMLLAPAALYCIGIFGLMLLSLIETIVVMYLIEKDSAPEDGEGDQSLNGHCCCFKGEIHDNKLRHHKVNW